MVSWRTRQKIQNKENRKPWEKKVLIIIKNGEGIEGQNRLLRVGKQENRDSFFYSLYLNLTDLKKVLSVSRGEKSKQNISSTGILSLICLPLFSTLSRQTRFKNSYFCFNSIYDFIFLQNHTLRKATYRKKGSSTALSGSL